MIALTLAPLSEAEAAELVGDAAGADLPAEPAATRSTSSSSRACAPRRRSPPRRVGDSVPPAVAAALAAELSELAPDARRLLDAAAVAGDPFEPELAAAVAELPEPVALHALDELLLRGLAGRPRRRAGSRSATRSCATPSTWRSPPAWRLGAHARARRRWSAAARGRSSALTTSSTRPAPATRTRSRCSAPRPRSCSPPRRGTRRASAPPRCGCCPRIRPGRSAARACSGCSPKLRPRRAIPRPRARRCSTRCRLPSPASGWHSRSRWPTRSGGSAGTRRPADGCTSRSASCPRSRPRTASACGSRSALTALMACDLEDAQAQASDARDDARAIGDPVFELAALAGGALASVSAAGGTDAVRRLEESTAALERLSGSQLATRLPALWMHGRARRTLGLFEASLADLERGATLARADGTRARPADGHDRVGRDADRARPPGRRRRGRRGGGRARPPLRQPADAPVGAEHARLGATGRGRRSRRAAERRAGRGGGDSTGLPRGRPTRLVPGRGADRGRPAGPGGRGDARSVRRSRPAGGPARRPAWRRRRSRRGAARPGRPRRRRGRAGAGGVRRGPGRDGHGAGDRRDRPDGRPARVGALR